LLRFLWAFLASVLAASACEVGSGGGLPGLPSLAARPPAGTHIYGQSGSGVVRYPSGGGGATTVLNQASASWNRWSVQPNGDAVIYSIPAASPAGGVFLDDGRERVRVVDYTSSPLPNIRQIRLTDRFVDVLSGNVINRYRRPSYDWEAIFLPKVPSSFCASSDGRWLAFSYPASDPGGSVSASWLMDAAAQTTTRLSAVGVASAGTAFSSTAVFWKEGDKVMTRPLSGGSPAVFASSMGAMDPDSLSVGPSGQRLAWTEAGIAKSLQGGVIATHGPSTAGTAVVER
jgi:hypothetical protein